MLYLPFGVIMHPVQPSAEFLADLLFWQTAQFNAEVAALPADSNPEPTLLELIDIQTMAGSRNFAFLQKRVSFNRLANDDSFWSSDVNWLKHHSKGDRD